MSAAVHLGIKDSSPDLPRHRGSDALLHLLRRDVLDVGVNPPADAAGVNAGCAVAVELVGRLAFGIASSRERLAVRGVAVVDIEEEIGRTRRVVGAGGG